jgi:hypothetical protein
MYLNLSIGTLKSIYLKQDIDYFEWMTDTDIEIIGSGDIGDKAR